MLRTGAKFFLFAAVGALAVLLFNLAVPSLLNFYFWSDSVHRWHTYLDYIVQLHVQNGTFARRPVVTFLITNMSSLTGIDTWWSFLVVQGMLLAASAFALAKLAERLTAPTYTSRAIFVFFLSFTVLFAFVTPNDCFDEYAQYFFLFLALHFLISNDQFRSSVGFTLAYGFALLARETSAFLLPSLLFLDFSRPGNRWIKAAKYLIPLAAYALYFRHFAPADDPRRYSHLWQDNFPDLKTGLETLVSLALAVSLGMVLLLSASRFSKEEKNWRIAFWIALPINTVAVLCFAQARESRLFALPLVFLWPFAGKWLQEMQERLRTGLVAKWQLAMGLIGTAVIMQYYNPAYRHIMGYRIYAAMIPIFCALAYAARDKSSRESTSR